MEDKELAPLVEGKDLASSKGNYLSLLPPQYLANVIPPEIPQASYDRGLIGGFFHRMVVKQIAKTKEFEAQISEANLREVSAKLQVIHDVATFSARLRDTFEDYDHNRELRKFEAERIKAEITGIQLDNQLTFYKVESAKWEAKMAEVEAQHKLKQLEEMENGS